MKISVITVCYNSASTIGDTINSIASQYYADKEYIVVDGNSSDATMDIVRASSCVSHFVSERDRGIYDAMNKGFSLATGDVIGTLNSDDFYINSNVLSEVENIFEDETVDACFADLLYVDQLDTNRIVRYWQSRPYRSGLFKNGWMPAHPTFFVRKRVYEQYGLFDLKYKIAADFELLFRLIEVNKIKTVYLPKVLIKMRMGGTTNKSIHNIKTQNREIIRLLQSYYPDFSIVNFWFYKVINRCFQFIKRPKKLTLTNVK